MSRTLKGPTTVQNTSYKTYFFDEFRLQLKKGCFLRGQVEIKLRKKSYEVLRYLVRKRGTD